MEKKLEEKKKVYISWLTEAKKMNDLGVELSQEVLERLWLVPINLFVTAGNGHSHASASFGSLRRCLQGKVGTCGLSPYILPK